MKIGLLKHPYPYKCSFTICNDCDYITREAFQAIHRFINTTDDSKLGKGLGLPIADSMFLYCEQPGILSYFEGISSNLSKDSSFLTDAVKEGWIDSLHGYGDFVNPSTFSRELAERALGELEKNNIKLKVWIDHGSADNSQNFNLPNILSTGDNPKHKAYHTDLLKKYGTIFVAGYNSDLIGQNGHRKCLAKPLPQPEVPFSFLKRIYGRFHGRRLLSKKRCRDRNLFISFCRARNGVLRPNAFTLFHQLNPGNVQKLIQSEGTMVLYQHLGSGNKRPNEFPYLDLEARRALTNIADKYHDKIMWVAPTSKLLTYSYLLENIKLDAIQNKDKLSIEITQRNDVSRYFEMTDLRNISFRVPSFHGNKIILKYGDYTFKRTEYEIFQDNGIVIKLHPGEHN